MSSEVLVDALPYFDQNDDEDLRAAIAMVDEECKRLRPSNKYLDNLPPLKLNEFETAMMSTEFDRIHNKVAMEPLNMKRYDLPAPSKIDELSAWYTSIENSMAQLEHQNIRGINLDLMYEYGCESWKSYLEVITWMVNKAEKRLAAVKADVNAINQRRKSKQSQAGDDLKSLEAHWVTMVSKNYNIEQVLTQFSEQLDKLEREKLAEAIKEREQTNGTDNQKDASEHETNGKEDAATTDEKPMETNESTTEANNDASDTNESRPESDGRPDAMDTE